MRTFLWYSSATMCASPFPPCFAQQVMHGRCHMMDPIHSHISDGEFAGPVLRLPVAGRDVIGIESQPLTQCRCRPPLPALSASMS